ncbi:ABC-ATPase domain-containing protein [Ectothiorhodospiraceae bacterium WFHF3C12]|nr:ABC-ATPase domain-containing protein [Ectothiorhodospiraceae bacterium WFHF3C12]
MSLRGKLESIDGRGYKAYKSIAGAHPLGALELVVDHVQADPFAAPSRARIRIPWHRARLPAAALSGEPRRRATRDYLGRAFRCAAREDEALAIDAGAQTVLERSCTVFEDDAIELRFTVALPARGRTIQGRRAAGILCDRLPDIAEQAAVADDLDLDALERHCAAVEDQVALRGQLEGRGLFAFVVDGANLARRSGVDDRPLADGIAFDSPDSLRVTLEAPNAGAVTGMGVPRGITLVVGGGFHGKSTLLNALELGVYDHRPGDGREGVVTADDAVKIRAEDGRAVHGVDLSPFINHLPYGKSTTAFSTELASGSTSQAASLQEALECGVAHLLVDEDTSATNFMIRDERMQALVAKADEPITPFVDRIRDLRERLDVSTVLVMGGSGDYFEHADTVIQMHDYLPRDVTAEARAVAADHRSERRREVESELERPEPRPLRTARLDASVKPGKTRVKVRGTDTLVFGRQDVDLRAVEQLADSSQLRAIGLLMQRLHESGGVLEDPVAAARALLAEPVTAWSRKPDGDLARPRIMEVLAAINRLRGP